MKKKMESSITHIQAASNKPLKLATQSSNQQSSLWGPMRCQIGLPCHIPWPIFHWVVKTENRTHDMNHSIKSMHLLQGVTESPSNQSSPTKMRWVDGTSPQWIVNVTLGPICIEGSSPPLSIIHVGLGPRQWVIKIPGATRPPRIL